MRTSSNELKFNFSSYKTPFRIRVFNFLFRRPYFKTRRLLNNLKNGIVNLWIWLPVIWNDRQWDHTYLSTILYKKISLMEKTLNHDHVKRSLKQKKRLTTCKLLLKRIKNESHQESWDELDEHHPRDNYQIFHSKKSIKVRNSAWNTGQLDYDIELLTKYMNKDYLHWWN